MATTGEFQSVTLTAGADLSAAQYKVVAVGGTIAAANTAAFGVLLNKPKSGEHAQVGYSGYLKAYAGGTVTGGGAVKVTTSGFLVAVASGDGAVGKALAAADSGSLVSFLGNFANTLTTY